MNTAHHGTPSWKAELSQVIDRRLSKVDRACLELAGGVARGLNRIGLNRVADVLRPPPRRWTRSGTTRRR
jgi:hypothetical protein